MVRRMAASQSSMSPNFGNSLLMERELITESLDQKLANSLLGWVVGVQRVRREKVAVEESGTRKPALVVSLVDDPMLGALIFAS